MLTIKHIEEDGSEGIQEARSVSFYDDTDGKAPPTVHAYGVPDEYDGYLRYGDGIVYVMNASGSTVAKYDLDVMNAEWARQNHTTAAAERIRERERERAERRRREIDPD